MKALTLHQPWASLIALGCKTIETRSWRTNYRGPIAIHAAKTFPKYARECAEFDFIKELQVNNKDQWLQMNLKALPQGVMIATAALIDCVPTERLACESVCFILNGKYDFESAEWKYGNYDSGRWGWILDNVKLIDPPILVTGKQGLWECGEING